MSSVYLIAGLVFLLTALVCYVFINQHLAKKRKQQNRVLSALHKRQALFKHMAKSFPLGFLSDDLHKFVYRILLNTSEQLARLEPQGGHDAEFQLFNKQMESLPSTQEKVRLNPEQVTQTRPLLQELQRYIASQSEKGRLPKAESTHYSTQIRRLLLQSTIDSYTQQAKQARSENKLRLAIHYYTLAHKLLLKEAARQNVKKQVEQLSAIINKLESEYSEQQAIPDPTAEEEQKTQKQWEAFDEDEDWKKKQIYD
ncbi:hypothetical protein [Gilvimarinus sp. DA14]|uniref:hypothetical protein n=1 Tax=Gilvimarinus sp. DA14 TaxID=2956798 RepID=UPI0020B6B088|nr:hypothetical protein [Gilvimarinus sp. DA14]UTF61369.1 hypothetical protein NHM04_06115 [Gilvimarinus sp. DA14]